MVVFLKESNPNLSRLSRITSSANRNNFHDCHSLCFGLAKRTRSTDSASLLLNEDAKIYGSLFYLKRTIPPPQHRFQKINQCYLIHNGENIAGGWTRNIIIFFEKRASAQPCPSRSKTWRLRRRVLLFPTRFTHTPYRQLGTTSRKTYMW